MDELSNHWQGQTVELQLNKKLKQINTLVKTNLLLNNIEHLIKELDADYIFSVENIEEEEIECPLCGTNHHNSIINRSSILSDKENAQTQLNDISNKLIQLNQKMIKQKEELKQVKLKINEINTKYTIEDDSNSIPLNKIVETFAYKSISDNIGNSKKEKLSKIDDYKNDQKEIKKYLFIETRNKDIYKPDYIFKNVIDDFIKNEDINLVLIDSLEELSDMLIFREQCVYIKNEYFEKWQNSILSVSPMLIIAYLIFKQTKKSFYQKEEELIKNIFKKTALPSIYEPQVSDIIKHKKLNEMHMHLNGSTEIDVVWQDAINQNIKFYNEIKKSFQNVDVSEQYLQISDFEQQDLYRLIKIASQIRDKLLSIIFNEDSHNKEYFNKNTFNIGRTLSYTSKIHPIKDIERNIYLNSSMQYEALFFIRCFDYLTCKKNTYFGKLFHYYMLIYSFFQKLLVQQKTQVGFDQFQKITFNETRELTEKKYEARYNQLQGMYFDSLNVLEGRFAPKKNLKESLNLLNSISSGYTIEHQNKFELKLVAHFIKEKDKRNTEERIRAVQKY